ncbi:YebC/PmpR family DNA-binding transcriptional regulator [Candidatus Aerophobetes bacterium]|uniref:Probable transcriptional regulatory protein COB11_03225 n=1 Tax=Aerophobetes bacterium TaxID=2030807 RepID=A0A2A4YJM5_UNCAE|nr:MAG: YebC/PmpR family DNA-binding transcriptional regulator [Candidatus Aerophobetes bacterium]
MAGHSKWANIKHKKSRADAAKGKLFSRITKEIINAVKQGGSDPKANPKLRLALTKAKAANLPNENIERNIKKASSKDQSDFTEMMYELYGHGGVGILAEVMTDNKNRISSDMRIATNKKGGSVATPGSVSFNFERKGVLQVAKDSCSEDELFLIATEAGAEDFEQSDEYFMITTAPDELYKVKDAIESKKILCEEATLEHIPKSSVDCDDESKEKNIALIEYLEDLDDVDAVFHNMNL